ncbi:MAG: superoxide dismutase, Ni [Candidatus Levybacteria bacterium]|nr:superoxide dismutase, Ni [Candidatus Levybacteria bacterium]
MSKILDFFIKILPLKTAYAHCDIPCGIYDPHLAQLAAHTVIRMTSLINDVKIDTNAPIEERKKFIHQLSRYTKAKEEHAEIIKYEVRVIWGDYFKPEHVKDNPELHELVFKIMKSASKAKQEINTENANELLSAVQQFAEIFWKTKNRESVHIASSYPTGGEIVIPK